MKRLFTARTGEHELTWGLYDRLLRWLQDHLDRYVERRSTAQWDKLDPVDGER